VDRPQVLHAAGEPQQQAALRRDRGGLGAGRRIGRGLAGRVGLPGEGAHLPRLPPPGPQHRRPGRHQRGQELPKRRRQRVPPLLRHHQGRRLPVSGGQRVPPGRGVGGHHRPGHRPGRALRPGVRRAARQPLLRRRPGVAHLLRPGPDRPAAPVGGLLGADAPSGRRHRGAAHPLGDAGAGDARRPGGGGGDPRSHHRRDRAPLGPRRGAGHRGLRQRVLPVDQRQDVQRDRSVAGPAKARCSPTRATPKSTPPAFRPATTSSRS